MNDEHISSSSHFWSQLRRLAVFQVKLYVDALRDLIMSPVSVLAVVLDLIQGKSGTGSNFEEALRFGRRSERIINLFNQYDDENQECDVDQAIRRIEESISRHYREGTLSEKAKQTLESALGALRGHNLRPAREMPPDPEAGNYSARAGYPPNDYIFFLGSR